MKSIYLYTLIYYMIGTIVSLYHIYYYRFSSKKSEAKPTDSIGGLFGPWIWPVQIIVHIFTRRSKKSEKI
jgi:hypothetical protein